MTFKTVHGLGRAECAIKAVNAALDKCVSPVRVDAWLKWFDEQPGDVQQCGICAECVQQVDGGSGFDNCQQAHASQCDHCNVTTVCPDDCPQPEYYLGDLEEVAHAMVTRTESALSELVRQMARPGSVATLDPAVKALFDGIRSEISLPGYVEDLLPE